MKKGNLKVGLLLTFISCVIIIIYYSSLETKSYNKEESYIDKTSIVYPERHFTVLVTEN